MTIIFFRNFFLVQMPKKFKSIIFPGKIVPPEPESGRTLEDVLKPWFDSDNNLILSKDVKIPPTVIEPSCKLVFRKVGDHYEFLGSTESETIYDQMADFSFQPMNPDTHIHTSNISKQSTPVPYNFEGNPNAAVLDSKQAIKQEVDNSGSVAFLRFRDQVGPPSEPTKLIQANKETSIIDEELLEKVKSLFDDRPVWQRANLEAALGVGPLPAWRLAGVLRLVSYLFLDGPWRKSYVRFGYDPRTDPQSKRLQMIDFRDPFFKSDEGKNSSNDSGENPDVYFRKAPINRSQLYQLCDIDDPGIQAVLSGQTRMEAADAQTGWMSGSEMESIRNQMKIKSESLRRMGK
jgi:hypothetical protein